MGILDIFHLTEPEIPDIENVEEDNKDGENAEIAAVTGESEEPAGTPAPDAKSPKGNRIDATKCQTIKFGPLLKAFEQKVVLVFRVT